MRLRNHYLAATALGAILFAVCAPACAPEEEETGTSDSNLTRAACPCSGNLSRGWFNGHDGADFAANYGTPIYATQAGKVVASGPAQGYGQWIRITHEDGSMTEYGHMQRRDVKVGQWVEAGQQIALVGSEGESTGPHLHLRTYRRAGDAHGMDPKAYLSARGISIPCKGGSTNAPKGTTCPGGSGEVVGAIEAKYKELGGCGSILGAPITDEGPTVSRGGRYNHFQRGSIYWSQETGAHEIHGAIRTLWSEQFGWEAGPLGYPLTDEQSSPDKVGKFSVFEGGSIYWSPQTGAHEVRGAIRDKYKELGWETGKLGYPVAGEVVLADGVRSDFQGGSIKWTRATGQTEVVLKADPEEQKDGGN